MKLSVIIATFNRAKMLAGCLDCLARQPFTPGDEIIVVDNGSTDATLRVIAEAAPRFAVPVKALYEPTPGKSEALMRALEVAGGDVLAFTDDDICVGPTWISAIRARMSDESLALMGGPVIARWERMPPAWLREATSGTGQLAAPLALLNYGPTVLNLGPRTVLGANMAVRRDAMARVGGFARHLGKLRGTLLSGEDQDLCRRVQAAGLSAVYDPAAPVHHWVPIERMRLSYYMTWFFWSGITHAALDGERSGRTFLGVPFYLLKRAAAALVAAPAAAASGNIAGTVERLIDIAFAAGYTTGRWQRIPSPALKHIGDRA